MSDMTSVAKMQRSVPANFALLILSNQHRRTEPEGGEKIRMNYETTVATNAPRGTRPWRVNILPLAAYAVPVLLMLGVLTDLCTKEPHTFSMQVFESLERFVAWY